MIRLRALAATCFLLTVAAGSLRVPAGALGAEGELAPAPEPAACGWTSRLSTRGVNVLFIDEAATYWSADVAVPEGGHVELVGSFPHARYMSFVVYDQRGRTVDHLTDRDIVADAGATNPFVAGARRDAVERGYHVRVVDRPVPAHGHEPNTLYTESADRTRTARGATVRITMRVYAPDGMDDAGGSVLPEIERVAADGSRETLTECIDDDRDPSRSLADRIDITRVLASTSPAQPTWSRFLPNGLGENVDNAYVYSAYVPASGELLVLESDAPTFPTTGGGVPTMQTGQLRYWSSCTARPDTSVLGCAYDEQVPVDDDGRLTVVISPRELRPSNATPECGVAWLPAEASGLTAVVYRHMLPDDAFAHAIQRAASGAEAETLGPYLPSGTYVSTADFESTGCAARPVDDVELGSSAVSTPGSVLEWRVVLAAVLALGAGVAVVGTRGRRRRVT